MGGRSRRNRQRSAMRPTSYTRSGGATYTADQVAEMLAADRRTRGDVRVPAASVAKAFGGSEPPAMLQAAQDVSQMGPQSPFSPGEPTGPYDGYSRTPRTHNFVAGTNIASRPRTHERVSFETLRSLVESYDVAQIAIWHKIDTLRGVRWKLLPADGYNGDVSGAVDLGMQVMRRPDGIHSFRTWFGKWFYDVFAYDAAPLYRMRNRGGQVVGLMPFDGTSLAPLLDYWGNPPAAPAEAYVQYVNGLPWNWLTRDDVIYEPFRAVNNSPYGKAPIESVVLTANTDIRFQLYFLQRFTDGNIPEAFASAPESWSPDQIEQFQGLWDSMVYGDQSQKHQIKWMPGGSTIAWSNEKDFTDAFSLFLMRKSCACYHVVPTDLGFTETSNYSSGESQADVQHKVGELPSMEYAEEIISRFLYDDLGLPIRFEFDRGEDQDDRLVQAQADDIYIKNGSVGTEDIREMRYGLPKSARPVPRFVFTERGGPIPLNAIMAVAGQIDPETGAPTADAPLPQTAFSGVEGALANPPLMQAPLAEDEFGPSALPPAPPMQPMAPAAESPAEPVAKDGGSPAAGITADTGLYGDPLERDDDEDEDEDREQVAKSELAAFSRFSRARRKTGAWRDFAFSAVDPVRAHRLNDSGRLAVRKAAGEIAVAGLAVLAADTGRVLMLQRALCDDDPAGGTWEFPGGHLEGDESPLAAAWREWQEEAGTACAPGVQTGTWTASNGIYQGIVWTIECEAMISVRSETVIANPDDPDGDQIEAIAWWDPAQLPGNPAVRPELLADIDAVMAALGCSPDDDCCGAECCADGCCAGSGGCTCGPASVAKAGDGQGPKGGEGAWPGWRLSDKAAAYWAPLVTSAASAALTPAVLSQMADAYLAANPDQQGDAPGKRDRNDAAYVWLTAWLASAGITLDVTTLAEGIVTDGYLIGAVSADAATSGTAADLGGWKPGDSAAAHSRVAALGAETALAALIAVQGAAATAQLTGGILAGAARTLAGADGDQDGTGDGRKGLAAALGAVVAGGALALAGVLSELYDAVASAALDFYRALAPQAAFAWVTDPTLANCAICLDNEASAPRPMDEPWPSGDYAPGIHIKCGCALVPA